MNEQERAELELLKQRHRALEGEMAELLKRLVRLEQQAAAAPAPTSPVPTVEPPKPAHAPLRIHLEVPKPTVSISAVPPVISPDQAPPPPPAPAPQPVSPLRLEKPVAPYQPAPAPVLQATEPPVPPPIAASIPRPTALGPAAHRPTPGAARPVAAVPEKSFEMRLGTYWLVRIGIVMVLTGLVFFGNLAYQKIISQLGPGGKVTLLYLASFGLIAAGAWWQRKAAKESLKNYAQVLLAGGLAAVYFTTYAAHHLPQLRVIQNPALDGALLLIWAGVIAWLADRRKSEVMGLFGVGLAYYSSIMTRVGYFTLFSNLVLAAAALFFLLRHRWAGLSLASLIATYGAYGFWRFFDGQAWHWASPELGLWTGTYFLICYWVIFTAAVFLSRSPAIVGENRAGFLTLNNGAFFVMFLLTMLQVQTGGFWKFLMVYGTVLLAMAVAASRVLKAEPLAWNSYLTQGLLLFTIGLITKFAGLRLALLLGGESVILLILGQRRKNWVLLTGAYITAALSVGWGMDGMKQFDQQDLLVGIGLGGLMLVNTFLVHRDRIEDRSPMRGRVAYFALLMLAIWWVATYDNVAILQLPTVLAVEALLLTMSIYALRLREVSLLSQLYLLTGFAFWFYNFAQTSEMPRWWSQALLLGVALGLSHWWQRQRVLEAGRDVATAMQGVYAAIIVGFLYVWLGHWFAAPRWMAMTALLAVVLTVYGVQTRAWFLAGFGQVFSVVTAVMFAAHLAQNKPGWHLAMASILGIGFLAYATRGWFLFHEEVEPRVKDSVLQFAALYRWAALAMSILWICRYIPEQNRVWLLGAIGLWIFLVAGLREAQESVLASAMFSIAGLALFWSVLLDQPTIRWQNLLLLVCIFAEQRLARRVSSRYPFESAVHNTFILAAGLSLWLFLSTWVLQRASGGFFLTASWSVLALVMFTFGVVFRERMYRWLGLGILACSLGRVIIFDVWKLETLYRILSFMALGIVLLVLGFIYNKYQEKIREWL